MFGRVPGTRPSISESHSEISIRVPFCIEEGWTGRLLVVVEYGQRVRRDGEGDRRSAGGVVLSENRLRDSEACQSASFFFFRIASFFFGFWADVRPLFLLAWPTDCS